jgi:drug/metabolite transporter (DMT)-like permease
MGKKDFNPKGHLAMGAANIMWGLMSPIAKLVMGTGIITPLLLTDCRVFGAALLFWFISLFTKQEKVPIKDLLRLAGASMLGILFNQGCFIFGVGFTSPGEASIITTTMPMWVMVLSALILKESITAKNVGGIVLGAIGALILVFNGASGHSVQGNHPVLGDILVLCAQLSYALYLTIYKNFINRYSLITLMKWMFTFAAIILIPVSLPTIISTAWNNLSAINILEILYVVICGTFLGYICIMIGQKNLRPTIVGMYNYLQPIMASIVGVWLGLDNFTPIKIVGVILIFGGVFMVTWSSHHKDIQH